MKRILLLGAVLIMGVGLRAADALEEVTAAAKKLGDAANYSWKTTVAVPADSQFKPGPTEGKADKEGNVYLTMTMRDTMTEAVLKGDKGAMTDQDGDWKSLDEMQNAEGFGRFRA